jgi:hypothetical protein
MMVRVSGTGDEDGGGSMASSGDDVETEEPWERYGEMRGRGKKQYKNMGYFTSLKDIILFI